MFLWHSLWFNLHFSEFDLNCIGGLKNKDFWLKPEKSNPTNQPVLLYLGDYSSISEELRPASMIQFEDIIPVSAQEGHCIDLLKDRIRSTIDEIHQREHQEDIKEQANNR